MLDYAFYLLYGLLAIRLVLALVAARPNNGFVRLISVVTDPFYALFCGIVPSPSIERLNVARSFRTSPRISWSPLSRYSFAASRSRQKLVAANSALRRSDRTWSAKSFWPIACW